MNHPDSPQVIVLPPLAYLAAVIVGAGLEWFWPRPFLVSWLTLPLAVVLLGVSMLLALSAKRAMRAAQTNIDPRKPTLAIVTSGPYRFTRNPLYLALTLLVLGVACAFNALWMLFALAVTLPVIDYGVIKREEAYLERKFGEPYVRYRQSVRRWL